MIHGVPIYYQVAGAGPPLILIHGLSGSSRWWRHNIMPLAHQFQVYTIDLIGFGRSRGRHPFVLTDAARYLTGWMDAVGIERASLVGHSMGGFIAADLAADFPERVDRLVLVDAAMLPMHMSYLAHALGLFRVFWRLPLGFMPVLFADALRAGPRTLWKAARELLSTNIWPKLARITNPTLIIWGEHDALVPRSVAGELQRYLLDTHLVIIPAAAHNPMWDRPAAFNQLVLQFLLTAGANVVPTVQTELQAPAPRQHAP